MQKRCYNIDVLGKTKNKLVLIAVRVHLFPSRTQKLSSLAPTIVAGRLAVKIGNANTKLHPKGWSFFTYYRLRLSFGTICVIDRHNQ